MIIGKIMMIQNSSSKESVEYLISKKIMELKGNIKDYTLNKMCIRDRLRHRPIF